MKFAFTGMFLVGIREFFMNNRALIADNIVILSGVILASALGLLIIKPPIVQRSMLRL